MPAKVELANKTFGMLTVVAEAGRDNWGAVLWQCRCECGQMITVRGSFLTQGTVRYCGHCPGPDPAFRPDQRIGRLTVVRQEGRSRHGDIMWRCQCDCGNVKVLPASALRSGNTQSCGCLRVEVSTLRALTHGLSGSPIYRRWTGMIGRTTNPNDARWAHYGGRGITVCERWRKFENFAEDMGPTFDPALQLDRIDNDGPYSPDNCRWATPSEQALNRRSNRHLEADGITLTLREWSRRLAIKESTIVARLKRGWSVERALGLTPAAEPKGGGEGERSVA